MRVTDVMRCTGKKLVCLTGVMCCSALMAAVLPEERADIMYHRYSGGGITIDGPSLLVRKDIAGTVSVSGNYYVDNVTSASIDVEASGASEEYTEERTEYTVGADYLYDKAIMSISYTSSDENDYEAETVAFGISQDFFGDLTTITLGYAMGDDTVLRSDKPDFEESTERQNFRFGISQVTTPSLLLTFNYEAVTDEGYLNNPYRVYRFVDPNDPTVASTQTEVYPRTHTSDAFALGGKYYLPYRAALGLNYRYFTDDWGIDAQTIELEYTHPFRENWIFDVRLRHYQQTAAYFYSDLHQTISADEKDFRARDKELSEYTTMTFGFGISYEFKLSSAEWIDKSSVSFNYDRISFDYDNFTDLTKRGNNALGDEPLYSFDADVIRLFLSVWY